MAVCVLSVLLLEWWLCYASTDGIWLLGFPISALGSLFGDECLRRGAADMQIERCDSIITFLESSVAKKHLLGAFAGLRKPTTSFVMSACPHGTTQLSLDEFP
jgi:hypothetical protein